MGLQWSEESHHSKEMARWNKPKRDGGMNANGFEPFPRMLYHVQRQPMSGQYIVSMDRDVISADKTVVLLSAEAFNTTCQRVVSNEAEMDRAIADGWRPTPGEAVAHHQELQQEIAQAAAERAYSDRNIGENARAEVKLVEEKTGAEHVAEVPEQKRRGRKPGSKNKPKDVLTEN